MSTEAAFDAKPEDTPPETFTGSDNQIQSSAAFLRSNRMQAISAAPPPNLSDFRNPISEPRAKVSNEKRVPAMPKPRKQNQSDIPQSQTPRSVGPVHEVSSNQTFFQPMFPAPWYQDPAIQSGQNYIRQDPASSNASCDEFDLLAAQMLASRTQQPSTLAAHTTWASEHGYSQPTYTPSTYIPTSSNYPWQIPYTAPHTTSVHSLPLLTSLESVVGNPTTTDFQPASFVPARGAFTLPDTPVSSQASAIMSPAAVSRPPKKEDASPPHRAGPVRTRKTAAKKLHGVSKELARPSVRGGPMTETQKSKADLVRDLGACWRCRRYKKSCDGPGECTQCMRGHFRVWPSSLGCRRGCLEELVAHLIPPTATKVLGPATQVTVKHPNWRFGVINVKQRHMIECQLPTADSWHRLSLKVQSTGMYGPEFGSLLDILVKYQATLSRPNALLEASIQLIDSTCDIYQNFVASAWPLPPNDLDTAITAAQRAYASICKMFLTSALSGRRRDWLPSFLSMCMSFVAVLIMMDAAIAVPAHAKTQLWGNIYEVSRDLRQRLYPVTTDLLRASSNGTKPFALGCWAVTEKYNLDGSVELERSPEGMRMLGGDKAAFDGMRGLQEWIRRNIRLLDLGTKVIKSDPFTTPEVPSIAAILKLFDL